MPSRKLKPPSDHGELLWAVISIIVMVFIMCSTACVSISRGVEPKWEPSIYRFKATSGRCTFYSPTLKHTLDCDEPLIQDFVLIHASQFSALSEKFNSCREWK